MHLHKIFYALEKLASLPKIQEQVYDLALRTMLAMLADHYEYEAPPLFPKLVTLILKQKVRSQLSKAGKLYLMK